MVLSAISKSVVKSGEQAVGSDLGVCQFLSCTVDFGTSDESIKSSEAVKVRRVVVSISRVGSTTAEAYNKPG